MTSKVARPTQSAGIGHSHPFSVVYSHAPIPSFFHRLGILPSATAFPSLAMENVTPAAFADSWSSSMEEWGVQIKSAVEGVAKMLGDGLGVGDALVKAGSFGPHLLAPTATNLERYGTVGESTYLLIQLLSNSNR